jgi:hypothetical protein
MPGTDRGDRGQTLALFAIIAPIILAFMALGLDAAQAFVERRDAQGAADLAALAGARLLKDGATPTEQLAAKDKAISVALANGYVITRDDVVTPYAGDAKKIQVTIDSGVDTFFMPVFDLFASGDHSRVEVDARAAARIEPGEASDGLYALYSLKPCGAKEDFKAIEWSGNENVIQGGVHSESGLTLSGNFNEIIAKPGETDTAFSVTCVGKSGTPTSLRITDKFPYNEGGDNPDLTPNGDSVPPDCTGAEDPGEVCREVVLTPDIPYFNETTRVVDTAAITATCVGKNVGGDRTITAPLLPGVYCATNGKMTIKAGTYSNVTFFAREFDISDANVKILSPNIDKILLYSTTSTEGKGIVYSGNNGQFGSPDTPGLILSPRAQSMISFAGEGNKVYGALVGYYVKFNGNKSLLVGSFGAQAAGPSSVSLWE